MTRAGSLMFRTRIVTLPHRVLPTSAAPRQRKCRFQICRRWVEKRDDFTFQQAGEIRSFRPIAFAAGKAKIAGAVAAPVLAGQDVFDVKVKEVRIVLM
jgi:hypothetical protein